GHLAVLGEGEEVAQALIAVAQSECYWALDALGQDCFLHERPYLVNQPKPKNKKILDSREVLPTHCFVSRFLKVSKCSEEIKNYIEERSGEDPLVKGIPEDRNPFKEKGGCVIA
ncbi:guanine nucleotide-binding protein G(I)/G(S)/G(O) subunit gamma-11-like, partial [Sceloporus undulatus]|uniref:guanine nucleotide-binding protein G(I)/G(S)/G(O) subunit gamma-11-like n=1 Tax=Sceloporus undulatus TaxID=8520 RepID=UPI001C4B21B6